jgi:glycosyltransferase involved in cell wall biosynthesis
MRIAIVSQEYPPETARGGIGSQAYAKAQLLTEFGHEVHVISRSPSLRRTFRETDGIKITRIPGYDVKMTVHTLTVDWLTYSSEVAATLDRIHKETPLDLVDFPEWASEGYVYLLNRSQWNYIPVAVQLHGPLVLFANAIGWPDTGSHFFRIASSMEETCLRLADAVYSSSQCSANWCRSKYGLTQDIPILHTGVDTSRFAPSERFVTRPTIVFAGQIAPQKGVFELVDAACQLATDYKDLQLRLLGRGKAPVLKEIKTRAKKSGRRDLVELVGFVSRAELPRELSKGDVFAGPSHYEPGPGMVYLEAMACGLPVIASAGSGGSEVVLDGETGYLAEPKSVQSLVSLLARVLSDPEHRNRMGRNARQHVVETADMRKCVKRLEQFYLSVARRSKFGGNSA